MSVAARHTISTKPGACRNRLEELDEGEIGGGRRTSRGGASDRFGSAELGSPGGFRVEARAAVKGGRAAQRKSAGGRR